MDIQTIHNSLDNGQRTQMVEQIKEYGVYGFFADYEEYLTGQELPLSDHLDFFVDATLSYFRNTER